MSRPSRAPAGVLLAAAVLALAPAASGQEPLFTFAQISDSQPQTSDENARFVEVLQTIAAAGQPGALLPRPVSLVLFAGDITWGNTRPEWESQKGKLDTWLTANDIPFLAVPGNHDVNNSDTALYEEYIADSAPWDVGSAAFTGHNGKSRTTFWRGLRFIGFNNSNPGWNTISSADLSIIAARVQTATKAQENVFLMGHHLHNERDRLPLVNVLPSPNAVGYLHGHAGVPHVTKGLSGIVNPNVYDFGSNAIYEHQAILYVDVYPDELRAHVVMLAQDPTSLPAPVVVPLVYPMTPTSEPDRGYEGPLHANARDNPTGLVPEHKLWLAGGSWWGVLWSDASSAWRIQRLDLATQTWTDTGPSVSTNPARSFDALFGGGVLVLASNVPTPAGASGGGSPGLVDRYTFDGAAYHHDPAFPVALNDWRSPTLSVTRDSAFRLWAAWVEGGSLRVSHTFASDDDWLPAISLASGLSAADTVALAVSEGQVFALWSSSASGRLELARRNDADDPEQWSFETASAVAAQVGGDLDVAAVDGRLLAAVRGAGGALNLFERAPGGTWSVHPLGAPGDALSSPFLVVDDGWNLLRLFATGPTPANQTVGGGGALWTKVAPLATLAFPPGRGTPVVQDGEKPSCGFATSTRQPVDGALGLVVLGSVEQTERYWHAFDDFTSPPSAPVAEFSAFPLSGNAPLVVDFTDLSSGDPTYWSWDFGDGSSATGASPQHVYAAAGTYTVTLRAANGGGEDVRTRTAYVQVDPAPPFLTFRPVADARANEGSPTQTAGGDVTLRVKNQSGSSYQSFLRFDLGTLPGSVVSAKLRLFCTDTSNGGGSVYKLTNNTWVESTLNWNNRPTLPPSALAVMGGVTEGFWTEIELGPAAVNDGLVGYGLAGGTTNSAIYSSREGSHPPELVIGLSGSIPPPVAGFRGAPISGAAPLSVAFADESTGTPTSWTWDFGDGTTSSERHPTHVYNAAGNYTVILDVGGPSGLGSLTRLDYVVVSPPPPIRTFVPNADTRANESSPTKTYGSETTVRIKNQSGSSSQAFLRFDLASLTGSVLDATLRLYCTDGSSSGGRLHVVPSTWQENTLTWSNKPALPASSITTLGAVVTSTWVEIDVTGHVTGGGLLSFGIGGGNTNTVQYSSRQGANPPQLIVTTGTPSPPTAGFAAAPLSGAAPLLVTFTDQSTGASAWSWDFGDGATSSERHPTHVYSAAGTYSVTLTATNAQGGDVETRADLVSVSPPSPVRTFLPIADSRPNEGNPTSTSGGTDPVLRVRQSAGASYHTYLRFDLSTVSGPVTSAKLRLFSSDGSDVAGLVYPTSGAWTEAALNWSNKPGATGALIRSVGAVATGAWAEFDVTSAVVGGGQLNLVIQSTSSNSCYYSSREGANPPELVITTGAP